jgi:hypothetical protein
MKKWIVRACGQSGDGFEDLRALTRQTGRRTGR